MWRLNLSILNNTKLKETLKEEIKTYLELNDTGEVNPSILWDALKAVRRGNITAKTTLIKRLRLEKLNKLQSKLKELQDLHKNKMDSKIKQEMNQIKKEIDEVVGMAV